jgi:prevent-host-death family protein
MATAGLRELRQQASELVRRAEDGETIVVTVNGREVAQLVPIHRAQWRTWEEIAAIFDGPADDDWDHDRDLVDQAPSDPFRQ